MPRLERAETSGQISTLPPEKSKLFSGEGPRTTIRVLKGSPVIMDWNRHDKGISHGAAINVPEGDVFSVGDGREVFVMNLDKTPIEIEYEKLPEPPAGQQHT